MKKTILAQFAFALSLLLLFAGCDALQDSLHDEMQAKVDKDTGIANFFDNTWFYNGTATEDVQSSTGFLRIEYGQQVIESTSGISGSFEITYYDATTGNKTVVTKGLNGGTPSGTAYLLDMSPVVEMLSNSSARLFAKGTATVTVKLSGLVCNAGSQKGRSVKSVSKKISIKPLYLDDDVNGTVCLTNSAPAGTKFAVALQGAATLTSSASITVTGTDIPSDATWSLAGTSLTGKEVYFTCNKDMSGKVCNANITINGIQPLLSGIGYTKTFTADFVPGVVCTDVTSNNFDLNKVIVYDDGTNLCVRMGFASEPLLYKNYRVTVLLDNAAKSTGGAQTNATQTNEGVATSVTLASGSSVEVQICSLVSVDSENGGSATTTDNLCKSTWGAHSSDSWAASTGTSLSYSIPLTSIGTTGNTIYVFVAVSACNNNSSPYPVGICDWAASGAATVSSEIWSGCYSAVTIDMTKAIAYTIK